MKKNIIILFLLFTACSLLASCVNSNAESASRLKSLSCDRALTIDNVGDLKAEVRGAWIATVYNINFPSAPDLPTDKLKQEIDEIIDTSVNVGLNTLFFQAHPCSDALYRSDLFPISVYLSSERELYFDPLEYIVTECHKNGISIYAWINPLRVTVNSFENKERAISSLDPEIGPGTTPELLVYYNDGKLYYDPGIPEVRDTVSNCVKEIISNYEVDGIVFDDYFYPYPTGTEAFDDSASYDKYSSGEPIDDWRRGNINTIIKHCYEVVKKSDNSIKFGVAPFGIWKNGDGGESGSLTSGLESYSAIYCDPITWAKEGYVDFISPQLYWSSESTVASYTNLYQWWSTALDATGVDYIPSLGAYNYGDGWGNPAGIISEQVSLARETVAYRGTMYYGLAQIMSNTHGLSSEIAVLNKQQYFYYDKTKLPFDLMIDEPLTGMVFDTETITIKGSSDVESPLMINGEKTTRLRDGTFEAKVSLEKGENDIVITCGDQTIDLKLYYQ